MSVESNKDLNILLQKATENSISVTINGKLCTINTFFSVNRLERFFTLFEACGDYRMAFAHIVYIMYAKTENNALTNIEMLGKQDFVSATDEELSVIISNILEEDDTIKQEYDKLDCENIFERFYIAHKNIVDESTSHLEKAFTKQMG